jgi:hypothetical protein
MRQRCGIDEGGREETDLLEAVFFPPTHATVILLLNWQEMSVSTSFGLLTRFRMVDSFCIV